MGLNETVDYITGVTTLVSDTNNYIANVTTDTSVTVPTSSTDGFKYTVVREVPGDNTAISLLNAVIVINPSTSASSFNLRSGTNGELIAYDNTYLVGRTARNVSAGIVPRYASSPSVPINLVDTVTNYLLTRLTMNTRSQPNSMTIVLTRISITTTVTGTLVLASNSALTGLIMSIPVTMTSSDNIKIFTTNTLLATTTLGTTYYVGWVGNVGNPAFTIAVNSIVIT